MLPWWSVGLCVLLGASCQRTYTHFAYTEVIERITRNECAGAQLRETPMLIGLWSLTDTTWVEYPGQSMSQLKPTTAVQLGNLTTSFLVPRILQEMADEEVTLDSTAIPVRSQDGRIIRNISYADLLLHRSDLPAFNPAPGQTELDQLLAMDAALRQQDQGDVSGRYKFNHWNYVLAATALRSRVARRPDLRVRDLAYTDQLTDSLRQALLNTTLEARRAPRERDQNALFAPSTAGIASAIQLVGLLDSLARTDLTELPSSPTLPDRPQTSIVPGWHKIEVHDGKAVLINSGRTRYFGAAVAYYPYTQTGVVVVSAQGKRLDCLTMDILRNLNQNWRRTPGNE